MRLAVFAVVFLTTIAGTSAAARVHGDDDGNPTTVRLDVSFVPDDERTEPLVIDGLTEWTVLTVTATAFEADTTGIVHQCVQDDTRSCHDELPVRFDGEGGAEFQYLVRFDAGVTPNGDRTCGSPTVRCTIEIEAAGTTTVIDAVFFDQAPQPGRIDVEPGHGLRPGDPVMLTATGFPPGTRISVMVCAAPATRGSRCGQPGPVATFDVGDDGAATADLILDVDEVGSDRVACGRRTSCRLVVDSDRPDVWARPVELAFDATPGAGYGTPRLMLGLGAALGLVLAAGWLTRSGDWSPPHESDGSAIDEATFADLDAEAAAHEAAETAPLSPSPDPSRPGG